MARPALGCPCSNGHRVGRHSCLCETAEVSVDVRLMIARDDVHSSRPGPARRSLRHGESRSLGAVGLGYRDSSEAVVSSGVVPTTALVGASRRSGEAAISSAMIE
jgi:hypothetical protein